MAKNNVKATRLSQKLTQSELAERSGVSRQTICLIESESYNPSLELCLKICKALDRTLDELFWDGKPKRRRKQHK